MNISVGGFAHTAWKMENGARLVFPSAAIVETQALGRGRIVEVIRKSASQAEWTVKSRSMDVPQVAAETKLPTCRPRATSAPS
jgi:hypothetical protein